MKAKDQFECKMTNRQIPDIKTKKPCHYFSKTKSRNIDFKTMIFYWKYYFVDRITLFLYHLVFLWFLICVFIDSTLCLLFSWSFLQKAKKKKTFIEMVKVQYQTLKIFSLAIKTDVLSQVPLISEFQIVIVIVQFKR